MAIECVNDQLSYNSVKQWDSVAHMALVAALETEFNVMMDTEEIIALSSVGCGEDYTKEARSGFIMKLNGKTALITALVRGIGAAIAEAFAKEGANIILSARTERVVDVAKQLQAQGYKVESILGDIADDLHVRELAKFCRTKFGGLDILVNNAGVLVSGKLGMMKVEDTRRIFDVNILAAINLTQYAIRLFPRGIGGVIINIASIAGTEGIDGLTSYSASKAAIIGFTKAAAKELASSKNTR